MAIQAWRNGGPVWSVRGDWAAVWALLAREGVDALSCTPTFADLLLQNEPPGGVSWAPRQITLGGEPLRPRTGERLRRRWPEARMLAVYASAEFGVLLQSERLDGWYEVAALNRRWPHWRIRDGVLELGQAKAGGEVIWRSTGDRVEQAGDLLRIAGRADQVANVGGYKVLLADVAAAAEEAPGVRRAVAVARPNPVTGEVVGLRFTVEPGEDRERVRAAVEAHLRRRLPKPAWPRDWQEEDIGLGPNAKRACG